MKLVVALWVMWNEQSDCMDAATKTAEGLSMREQSAMRESNVEEEIKFNKA